MIKIARTLCALPIIAFVSLPMLCAASNDGSQLGEALKAFFADKADKSSSISLGDCNCREVFIEDK